jgi:hypothetical protein
MSASLVCWKCGAELTDEPLPLARLAECRRCRAELHVCRMCESYDPRVPEQCIEERAEPPADKVHANFCDYFSPHPQAYAGVDDEAERAARAKLEALFGAGPPPAEEPPSQSDSETERARRELERLFGKR